jgi:hypothetical protein
MRKLNKFAAVLTVSGTLLLSGCSEVEEAAVYPNGYSFESYRVELVNDKSEVFADSLDTEGGLYLDNNRNGFQVGDKINGVFDESGDLIAAELVE